MRKLSKTTTKVNNKLPGSAWYSYFFVFFILKPFLFLYFMFVQNVHFHRRGHKQPRGPAIYLGNHHSNWDGFYHAVMFYWQFPHFIVHDEVFKNKRRTAFFGNFLGQVSRSRDNDDIAPVLMMRTFVQAGQSVAVYPEGDIHMFGDLLPFPDTIAKMARILKVPIVLVRIKGAHLRAPRWSKFANPTKLNYEIARIISVAESRKMTTEQLHETIKENIRVNSYELQMKKPQRVWGIRRAEWIELGLYYCPICQQFETITSKGNYFVCINCGQTYFMNKYLLIESSLGEQFRRPDDWDRYQYEQLRQYINDKGPDELLFTLNEAMYETVALENFFDKKGQLGRAYLYKDRIEFISDNLHQTWPITEVEHIILQYKDVCEWHNQIGRYRLWSKHQKWSAYLWVNSVNLIKK